MNQPACAASPAFHEGECAVQERVGVREQLAAIGQRAILDFMPEQHREFLRQLPFVIAGSVDSAGQPWASVLTNPPGFIESPSPRQLAVRALPQAFDPLKETLLPGKPIALLGIEPHSRRRNRVNGVITEITGESFAVQVRQSFGNCPKYIQARKLQYPAVNNAAGKVVQRAEQLNEAAKKIILGADTFFIATSYPVAEYAGENRHGADASHRGGRPGFVRVEGNDTLLVPDFTGNFYFNTLGNIAIHPRAGLLFIDFDTGGLLYLAVDAEIVWQGKALAAFAGAQRLLRFRVREVRHVEAALPLRWGAASLSPFLEATGSWQGGS
ncbi:MAG: pyridoxamine 5'-phosphate oxidase family protein [Betaproteobacteria bacterium]|nr:pyridoxamine 5'-phosphate oxidase family protein [Betaproteobacteria bacterium]